MFFSLNNCYFLPEYRSLLLYSPATTPCRCMCHGNSKPAGFKKTLSVYRRRRKGLVFPTDGNLLELIPKQKEIECVVGLKR